MLPLTQQFINDSMGGSKTSKGLCASSARPYAEVGVVAATMIARSRIVHMRIGVGKWPILDVVMIRRVSLTEPCCQLLRVFAFGR
jgi:hypothetical protein